MNNQDSKQFLKGVRCFLLVAYNLVVAAFVCWELAILLAAAPLSPTREQTATDPQLQGDLLSMLTTMALAGAAGGALCNLRGIFKWVSQEGRTPHPFRDALLYSSVYWSLDWIVYIFCRSAVSSVAFGTDDDPLALS